MSTRDDLQGIIPAQRVIAVTPDDDTDLATHGNPPRYPRGISVGAGTLAIHDLAGEAVTYANGELAAGHVHLIGVRRVLSTGTSATLIKVYY